jgi:hypothetical protein
MERTELQAQQAHKALWEQPEQVLQAQRVPPVLME